MADIDIERKERRSWIPWILAAVIGILAVWAVIEVLEPDAPVAGDLEPRTDPALTEPAPAPAAERPVDDVGPAVADFRRTCVDAPASGDMGRQHQFTIACVESMTAAMESAIRTDTVGTITLDERLNVLRDRAARVRASEPDAATHAGTVAGAFEAGAELVEAYENERGTDLPDLSAAADAIDPDRPLLEQEDAVRDYFRQMADALASMTT